MEHKHDRRKPRIECKRVFAADRAAKSRTCASSIYAALPFDVAILRIDTNQGISGYGEVRDGASPTYALLLKSRLLGENPCNIDKIFRQIKQFGFHGRQGGGVCGIEMALFDLAGKAYGVPAYQLAGGKFRDKALIYCDTDSTPDGAAMGARLKERMDAGFRFLKMDIGIGLLEGIEGAVSAPPGMLASRTIMHPFTGIQITDIGVEYLVEYVRQVRNIIGYEIPLAADHFGHINVESCIRLGQALDQFSLAWYEDMIPWQFSDQWLRLKNSVLTPVCTGEDIYLKEGFMPLLEAEAVSVIHPDLATSGGIMETKKIGDLAGGIRRADGHAHGGIADLVPRQYPLRRRDREFLCAGEPLGGPALVGGSDRRHREAADRRRLRARAGSARPGLRRAQRRSDPRADGQETGAGRRLLRAD